MRILILLILTGPAFANDVLIEAAAHKHFDKMPEVVRSDDISSVCGAARSANQDAVYCTSENRIYLRRDAQDLSYKLAHLFGHAVQVNHGVADIALREVRARRDEEASLRAMVTRQVECIAGFLHKKASVPPRFTEGVEPFTGSHWGRNPLRIGPQVSIGAQTRMEWLSRGYGTGDLAACASGEIGAELLLKAFRE